MLRLSTNRMKSLYKELLVINISNTTQVRRVKVILLVTVTLTMITGT